MTSPSWISCLLVLLGGASAANAASLSKVYQFKGGMDGSAPSGGLLQMPGGSFIGTTQSGGARNAGTVFVLQPPSAHDGSWQKKTIYSFSTVDGAMPQGNLVGDGYGRVYGTTASGGAFGQGAVFRLDPPTGSGPWILTTLWSFGASLDGRTPSPQIVITKDGTIYGTCSSGGTANYGTVFKIAFGLSGKYVQTVLWNFTGGSDGAYPASLIRDISGNLYGVTAQGGNYGVGTVFEVNPLARSTAPTSLLQFQESVNGAYPTSLAANRLGTLYGTVTVGTGQNSSGSVFTLDIVNGKWSASTLFGFSGGTGGAIPYALTVQGRHSLAGVAASGGSASCSTGHVPVQCGTAFIVGTSASRSSQSYEKILWDFEPSPAPSQPSGNLLPFGKTAYIGETLIGGSADAGAIFLLQR